MAGLVATWMRLVSTERLQRSSQAFSVLGSRAYLFGGELQPREPVDNQIDVVDLEASFGANASTEPAPSTAPAPRVGTASAVLNSHLYLYSGRGGTAMDAIDESASVWRYDPASNTWTSIQPADPSAPAPTPRSYHAMTSDGQSTLDLHAGCPSSGRLSDLWAFDVGSRTWTELPSAPDPARGGTSIAYCQGKLYRHGGFDGKTEQGGAIDVYDVQKGSWSVLDFEAGIEGPEARSVAALVLVQVAGRDYLVSLFGERDPSSMGHAGAGKMLDDVWAFDVQAGTWVRVEAVADEQYGSPAARGWFGADGLDDGVVVQGGLAEDNSRLGDVWKLTFVDS